MSSWFDEIEQPEDKPAQPEPSSTPSRQRFGSAVKSRPGLVWLIPAVLILVILLVWSVWFLASPQHDRVASDQPDDTTPATTAEQTPTAQPASPDQVAVAGQCEPEEGEARLSTGDQSLRGVVASWQDAYYTQDTELTRYLTEDSWLHEQDWEAILPEAAPEGVSWCVVMAPVDGAEVDVDVMVRFPDQSTQTYQQTVHGVEDSDGTWRIDDIAVR